jgi:hypothetical protein
MQLWSLAKRCSSPSSLAQTMLDTIGDVGPPWGSWFSQQQIRARTVAALAPKAYGFAMNMPRTRPKLIEGKKSSRSMFSTNRLPVCLTAFDTMLRSVTNP